MANCLSWSSHRKKILAQIPIMTSNLLSNQSNERSNFPLETHLEMLVNWQTTLSGRKRCFFYSEDQPLSGMRITLPTLPRGKMFEQNIILEFQSDETNFDTKWMLNVVLEEMQKKLGTSYNASRGLWIKGGQMIWKDLPQQTMWLKELLKDDKEDKDTSTTQ